MTKKHVHEWQYAEQVTLVPAGKNYLMAEPGEIEYRLKFACECGATKLVKEKRVKT